MACWSARVDAAEAKKAEGASIVAFLKPVPSFLTGSVAWSHWVSSKSTFSIDDKPALRVSSNFKSNG